MITAKELSRKPNGKELDVEKTLAMIEVQIKKAGAGSENHVFFELPYNTEAIREVCKHLKANGFDTIIDYWGGTKHNSGLTNLLVSWKKW